MPEVAEKALEALKSAAKLMTEAELEYYTGRAEGYEEGFAKAAAANARDSNEPEDE